MPNIANISNNILTDSGVPTSSLQPTITLTTTGTSGASTLISNTLNIPDYGSALSGYVTLATAQTITGSKTFDNPIIGDFGILLKNSVQPTPSTGYIGIGSNGVGFTVSTKPGSIVYNNNFYFPSASNSYTLPNATGTIALVGGSGVGTVTSVSFTLGGTGTDLNSSVTNSTTTPVITLNVPTASAANRGALSAADWSTFNTKVGGVTATSPLFSSGGSTPNITIQQSSGSQAGFLSAADWTTFNNKQASGNYITSLTGEATATGPGAAAVTLNNASVTAKILTGINITGGTVLATDSILTGFGKLQNQVNGLIGGSIYQGTWNAATNTPTLTSSVGTQGYYYIVSVAGTTNLDGITDWFVGDWAIFNGGVWQQVDNTDAVVSVNGQTGAVSLTTDNIPEGTTNLYYTNTRARAALSFVAGSGAYNSSTGAITIPTNTSQLTNGANFITLASLSGTAPISYNSGTGAISITQSGTASNGYLSSTDWNTFNNKQATITLTTTGTSGAATLVGTTLNIPQYQSVITNPVTGTGTPNKVARWGTTTGIVDSFITDAAGTATTIIKDGTSVFAALLSISPLTGTNASILNLDNSGAGSFYLGRANSTGGTPLLSVGAYDSVIGHTGLQAFNIITSSLSRITVLGTGEVGLGCTPSTDFSLDIRNLSSVSNNVLVNIKNTSASEDVGLIIDGNSGGTQYPYRIGLNVIENSSTLTFSSAQVGTAYKWFLNSASRMYLDGSSLFLNAVTDPNIGDASTAVQLVINGDQHFTRQGAKIYFGDAAANIPLSIGEGFQADSGLDKDFMSIYHRNKLVILGDPGPGGYYPTRVGIGKTVPGYTLDISNDNITYNRTVSYWSGTYMSGWLFSDLNGGITYDAGNNILNLFANWGTDGTVTIQTKGTTKVAVLGSGNLIVGDGTTDDGADYRIQSKGSILIKGAVNSNYYFYSNVYASATATIRVQYGGNWQSGNTWGIGTKGATDSTVYIGNASAGIISENTFTLAVLGTISVPTSGGTTQIYNTGSGHTVITNSTVNKDINYQVSGTGGHYFAGGNVTISKTTPGLILDGLGSGNSGAYINLQGWAATNLNWQIGVANIGPAGLLFTPSTAAGGTTFSSSVISFSDAGRISSVGLSSTASITSTGPLLFSGTSAYIYQYARLAQPNSGCIIYNNGTGANMFFGEVATSIYGFGNGGTGTAIAGTSVLSFNMGGNVGININAPAYSLDVNGNFGVNYAAAFSSSNNQASDIRLNVSIPAGSTFNSGGIWSGITSSSLINWGGSSTINNGAINAGILGVNRHSFTTTGTITLSQSGGGIRAVAAMQVLQQTGGSVNGTISHGASLIIQGIYPTASANITYTNYYGLLINNLTEWGGVTLGSRYAIYQAGTSDVNYFAGIVGAGTSSVINDAMLPVQLNSVGSDRYFGVNNNGSYGIVMGWSADGRGRLAVISNSSLTLETNNIVKIAIKDSVKTEVPLYSTYTKSIATPNGGTQTVRIIEDALGQWILVGRFAANAMSEIQGTWSTVRGLSTDNSQSTATAFSADFGDAYPTEVRVMGATDFTIWRDTRTVDFVYRVPAGRQWKTFFNGGNTDGTFVTSVVPRYGWDCTGTYDGFGRWNNPLNTQIGMSDGAYTNPSASYTTPSAGSIYWNTASDAKMTAIHEGVYSGQDANETTGFGADDGGTGFFDTYPNTSSNMGGGNTFSSAVWILIKLN